MFNVSYVYERIGRRPYYDPLTILAFAAARTERITLGTSVLVLPYHNPMRLAKQAATLDQLSGGRLTLGVGVGVIDTELEAMGVPFAERGAYTDESIAIMQTLWRDDNPQHEGRFFRFSGMAFSPRPAHPEGIPLLIGGVSRAAIRRAAPPRPRLASHRHAAGGSGRRASATWANRPNRPAADPASIPVSVSVPLRGGRPGRFALGAEPAEMRANARAYADLGVSRIVVSPYSRQPLGSVLGSGDHRRGGNAGRSLTRFIWIRFSRIRFGRIRFGRTNCGAAGSGRRCPPGWSPGRRFPAAHTYIARNSPAATLRPVSRNSSIVCS